MSHPFFKKHYALLERAVETAKERGYWSAYPEMPSPKVYGEGAAERGKAAFDACLNRPFEIDHPGAETYHGPRCGQETSPYGFALKIDYPKPSPEEIFPALEAARKEWSKAGPDVWAGVCLEILARLNERSFEIAHAVMHTTGQAFMMAFQAGGPHAQDRGLEAVAYAWDLLRDIPRKARWEKPQGKHEPLVMEKRYRVVPRGVGLVIGCCTFPTWNGYPGLFASLATGNAVLVKPHPGAILPLAISVKVAREVIREAGFDPNVVMLATHDPGERLPSQLALRPEVKLIDFTGSSVNGEWLERNAIQARVFTEKAGVNQILVDGTDNLKGMAANIAFSLSLYTGQMCTAPQNIYIPENGIDTPEGHLSFDEVAAAIGQALEKLLGPVERAVEILGAVQNYGVLERIGAAREIGKSEGRVIVDSVALTHPAYPGARVHTPLLVRLDAGQEEIYSKEWFGPIAFLVATKDTAHSLEIAGRMVCRHGALTLSLYSTDDTVIERAVERAEETGVALSINLTSSVYVNQSAAFSDYHGTGANPAANAALTDAAFVAGRFTVAQHRYHV